MFNLDSPITKSSDDILNRASFAESLADALIEFEADSSLAVGLYGEWGSGKTSLLNMIIEKVEDKESDIVVIRFNPWLCSDPKQLICQFFKQMAAAIKLKNNLLGGTWTLIDKYADILDAAEAVPVPFVGEVVKALGKTLSHEAGRQLEQRYDLQAQKNKIIKKMKEERLKIIVSIDDIDRLSEQEIIAVFQLVKALGDFPNTAYLLTFDYKVVTDVLSSVQQGDGRAYLEKIIQVPFEIPAPRKTDIHNELFSKLNGIIDVSDNTFDSQEWSELFYAAMRRYIKTIRDINRYMNIFSMKYSLMKKETDAVDLMGLTCLQVFEPHVYARLRDYRDSLCGDNTADSSEYLEMLSNTLKNDLDNIIDDRIVSDKIAASNILLIIFPRTNLVLRSSYSVMKSYDHRDYLIRKKAAVSEYFDRYFALTLEQDAIPKAVIEDLIYKDDLSELEEKIMRFRSEDKIEHFIDEVEAYANNESSADIPEERAEIIITALMHKWHLLDGKKNDGLTSIPFVWRMLFCIDALISNIRQDSVLDFIKTLFKDEFIRPSSLAVVLQDMERKLGRFTDKTSSSDNAIVKQEDIGILEDIFVKRVIADIDTREVLKYPHGLHIWWMFDRLAPELSAEKKKTIITDDFSLIKVVESCTSEGIQTTGSTITEKNEVDMTALSQFIDIGEAYRRITDYMKNDEFFGLSDTEQTSAMSFVTIMEEKGDTRQPFDNIISKDDVIERLKELKEVNAKLSEYRSIILLNNDVIEELQIRRIVQCHHLKRF